MKETEIKAKVADLSRIKKVLADKGAQFKSRFSQRDYYLEPEGKSLYTYDMKESLRMRVNNNEKKGYLIRCFCSSIKKESVVRKKTKIEVSDHKEMLDFFKAFGFNIPYTINKIREVYVCNNITIKLDNVRKLGNYIELTKKGEDQDATRAELVNFLSELGIKEKQIDSTLYLWKSIEKEKGASMAEMILGQVKSKNEVDTDLINFAKNIRPGKVLDIGCRYGLESIYLAKNGFNVIGVDKDRKKIAEAKKKAKKEGAEVDFRAANFFDYINSVKTNEFDYIVDCGFSHFLKLEQLEKFYREVSRVLKHGGMIFTKVYSAKDPISQQRCPKRKWTLVQGLYYNYLEKKKIIEILNKNGLNVVQYQFVGGKEGEISRYYHIIYAKQTIKRW